MVSRDQCRIPDLVGYGLPGGQKHLPELRDTVRDLNYQLKLSNGGGGGIARNPLVADCSASAVASARRPLAGVSASLRDAARTRNAGAHPSRAV